METKSTKISVSMWVWIGGILASILAVYALISGDKECHQKRAIMSLPMWLTTMGIVNLILLLMMVIITDRKFDTVYTGLIVLLLVFNFGWAIFGSVILAEEGPCYSEDQDSVYYTAIFADVAAYVVPLGIAAVSIYQWKKSSPASSIRN